MTQDKDTPSISKKTSERLQRFDSILGPSSSSSESNNESDAPQNKAKSSKTSKSPKESTGTSNQIPKKLKKRTYSETMLGIESKLPSIEGFFSKFMRLPFVDGLGNILARSILRPSGLLGAGIVSIASLLFLIAVSQTTGFMLSGSEFFYSLFAGWILGLAAEACVLLFRGTN